MKAIFIFSILLLTVTFSFAKAPVDSNKEAEAAKTIYDFKIKSINGGTINFADYKGKMILIVNTASKCGYTPQYEGLEKLYEKYKDQLVIVGFPSDNFGGQEYKHNNDIFTFCQKNYGVTFPLTTRVDVKGSKTTPVYNYLCNKSQNGVLDATIQWNFNKFLIDENGKLLAYFDSNVKPEDFAITRYLDNSAAEKK